MILDAHLDLAMNALEWNRDLSRPIAEIREREAGLTDKRDRGNGTVSFGEMRRGGVRLCVATLIARWVKRSNPRPGWHSAEQAWAQVQGQLAWYRAMTERGELSPITTASELDAASKSSGTAPIGFVLSLEGADSLITVQHLERLHEAGLRAVGPGHYGPGTYAAGTEADGGISPAGLELLREMSRLGMILDTTHLTDEGFWQALDAFDGAVWASHQNCRALVPGGRQFSDEQIREVIARGGVIGVAMDAWMLAPGWERGVSTPAAFGLTLEAVANHMDHVCQLAGNAEHVGIGSDLDGGFGNERVPADLDTIGDLAKLPVVLAKRGWSGVDVDRAMGGNFLSFLRRNLPR